MAKKRIISISVHIGDWQTGTIGMDATEIGAYWSLTMALYANDGRISADDARLKRMSRVKDQRTWNRIRGVVLDKFDITDGELSHTRVDEELGRIKKTSQDASDAAKARWEAKRARDAAKKGSLPSCETKDDIAKTEFETTFPEKDNKNNGDELDEQSGGNANHYPLTNNINIIDAAYADEEVDPAFEAWFETFPPMAYASYEKAYEEWQDLTQSEREHAAAVVGTYAKLADDQDTRHRLSPQRWLGDKRFKNFARPKAGTPGTSTAISIPDEGTDARIIFDALKAAGVARHVWHSWLGVDKVTIRDGVLIPRNDFTRREIDNRWGHIIKAAGYEVGARANRNVPGAGHLAHKAVDHA